MEGDKDRVLQRDTLVEHLAGIGQRNDIIYCRGQRHLISHRLHGVTMTGATDGVKGHADGKRRMTPLGEIVPYRLHTFGGERSVGVAIAFHRHGIVVGIIQRESDAVGRVQQIEVTDAVGGIGTLVGYQQTEGLGIRQRLLHILHRLGRRDIETRLGSCRIGN